MRVAVPAFRPSAGDAVESYIGRHRQPENPPARDLAELEGRTRDLHGPAGMSAAAPAVWGYGR